MRLVHLALDDDLDGRRMSILIEIGYPGDDDPVLEREFLGPVRSRTRIAGEQRLGLDVDERIVEIGDLAVLALPGLVFRRAASREWPASMKTFFALVADRELPPAPVREPLPDPCADLVREVVEIAADLFLAVLLLDHLATPDGDALRAESSASCPKIHPGSSPWLGERLDR